MSDQPATNTPQTDPLPEITPELAARLFARAVELEKGKQWEAAIPLYRAAADAGNQDAAHNLAIRSRARGDRETAARYWPMAGHLRPQGMRERVRTTDPKTRKPSVSKAEAERRFRFAVAADNDQQGDDALIFYRSAAMADHRDAAHNLAIRLRERGELDEAAAWWRAAGHDTDMGPNEELRTPPQPRTTTRARTTAQARNPKARGRRVR